MGSPNYIKGSIILALLENGSPVRIQELKDKLGVTREDIKYHLRDRKHGLYHMGVVKERQGKVFLSLRNEESAFNAVKVLSAKKWFLNALERSFTECYTSGFGDFLSLGEREITDAIENEAEQIRLLQASVTNDLVTNGHRIEARREMIELCKVLSLQEGDNTGFMFAYIVVVKYLYDVARAKSPDEVSMDDLSMGNMPRSSLFQFVEWINKMYRKDGRNLLLETIKETYRRGVLEELTGPSEQNALGKVIEIEKINAALVHKIATIKRMKIVRAAYKIGKGSASKDDFPLELKEIEYESNGTSGKVFYRRAE